jgi:integration host factor subunit alpha
MTTTKDEIVKSLAKENGFQKKRAIEVIETLLELIKSSLASGDDVLISGFGKFCVNEKRQRRGRNPATGEDIMLEARRVVTFRCSRHLREKINQQRGIR